MKVQILKEKNNNKTQVVYPPAQLSVETSLMKFAGTADEVKAKLMGTLGETSFIPLPRPLPEGSIVHFEIPFEEEIGEIIGIELYLEDGDGWNPLSISLSARGRPEVTIEINQWIKGPENGTIYLPGFLAFLFFRFLSLIGKVKLNCNTCLNYSPK